MKPYSSLFFAQGQYRHIMADSPQEAHQVLVDFTIDRLVEPIGVYDSFTNDFTRYAGTRPGSAFADHRQRLTTEEIRLNISRLRHRSDQSIERS